MEEGKCHCRAGVDRSGPNYTGLTGNIKTHNLLLNVENHTRIQQDVFPNRSSIWSRKQNDGQCFCMDGRMFAISPDEHQVYGSFVLM